MEAKPKINQTVAIFTAKMEQKLNYATFYVESTIFGMSSQILPRIYPEQQCILYLITCGNNSLEGSILDIKEAT